MNKGMKILKNLILSTFLALSVIEASAQTDDKKANTSLASEAIIKVKFGDGLGTMMKEYKLISSKFEDRTMDQILDRIDLYNISNGQNPSEENPTYITYIRRGDSQGNYGKRELLGEYLSCSICAPPKNW